MPRLEVTIKSDALLWLRRDLARRLKQRDLAASVAARAAEALGAVDALANAFVDLPDKRTLCHYTLIVSDEPAT